jgi:hypothetical protein
VSLVIPNVSCELSPIPLNRTPSFSNSGSPVPSQPANPCPNFFVTSSQTTLQSFENFSNSD